MKQLRDAKGRFLKIRMNEKDWEKLLHERWEDVCRLREANHVLRRESKHYQDLWLTELKRRNATAMAWSTFSFIAGTILFLFLYAFLRK